MRDISIVIVNWNAGLYLKECVQSILQYADDLVDQIIIVDNASSDNSLLLLPSNAAIKIIKNATNKGFASACNQGYAIAKSEFILLLNPDTRLLPNTLQDSVKFMRLNLDVSILGAMHKDENDRIQPSCSRFPEFRDYFILSLGLHHIAPRFFRFPVIMVDYDYSVPGRVDQVMGAFMFIRKSVIDKLGVFMDERFFVYLEDVDFAKQVSLSGGISYYEPTIKIFHKGSGTTENIKGIRLFYNLESRLKYIRKYYKRTAIIVITFLTLFVEPVARIVNVLFRLRGKEAHEIMKGYSLLYRKIFTSKIRC